MADRIRSSAVPAELVRVVFPEGDDHRIVQAAEQLSTNPRIDDIKVFLGPTAPQQHVDRLSRCKKIQIQHLEKDWRTLRYSLSVDLLHTRTVEILVVGADVAFSSFLPGLFSQYSMSRDRNLLFSVAPVEWIERGQQLFLLDPAVLVDPTVDELVRIVHRTVEVVPRFLHGESPRVCFLSHVSGPDSPIRATKQGEALQRLRNELQSLIHPTPLQLDAALDPEVARRKVGVFERPNILVLPDITAANVLYKSIELFGGNRIEVCAPFLCGLPHGNAALLPRSCTPYQIEKSVAKYLLRLSRMAVASE